jgi:hypothetical protein
MPLKTTLPLNSFVTSFNSIKAAIKVSTSVYQR